MSSDQPNSCSNLQTCPPPPESRFFLKESGGTVEKIRTVYKDELEWKTGVQQRKASRLEKWVAWRQMRVQQVLDGIGRGKNR